MMIKIKCLSIMAFYSCILCSSVIGEPERDPSSKKDENINQNSKSLKHEINETKNIISFFNDLNNQLPSLLHKLEKEIKLEDTNSEVKNYQPEDDEENDYSDDNSTENESISKVVTKSKNQFEDTTDDNVDYLDEQPTTSSDPKNEGDEKETHIKANKKLKTIPIKNSNKKLSHAKNKPLTRILHKTHSKSDKSVGIAESIFRIKPSKSPGSHSYNKVSSKTQGLKKNAKSETTESTLKQKSFKKSENMYPAGKRKFNKRHKYHTKLKASSPPKREIFNKIHEGMAERSRNYIRFDK